MERLIKLQELCKAGVEIYLNQHKSSWLSVHNELESHHFNYKDEIEQDVLNKMIETDTLIEIRLYLNTPVGYHNVYHYDLNKALDIAIEKWGMVDD